MLFLAFVCSGLLAATPDTPSTTATATATPSSGPSVPDDLRAYEAMRDKVGRDPAAHVSLALWCEGHGLDAERLKHLTLAVLIDPKNARARGLLGLVADRDRWVSPEKVGERIKADDALAARLAEYNARRDALLGRLEPKAGDWRASAADAARAHVALASWCRKNGLEAEARAHSTSAVVLDPYNEGTWKGLGYVRHDGRWMSRGQVASERDRAARQRRADRYWEPLLLKWRGWLADEQKRDEARANLAEVRDPLALPAVLRVFRDSKQGDPMIAVQLLGQIDDPAATKALAVLAVLNPSEPARAEAIRVLQGRERRDYAGMLVDRLRSPMRYQVQPVGGPGSPGALMVETPRFRMLRMYDAPPVFQPGANFHGYVGYDINGLPIIESGKELRLNPVSSNGAMLAQIEMRTAVMIAQANLKAVDSQQRLVADIQAIEADNLQAGALNGRISETLAGAASAPASELKDDEDAWHRWWYDQLGYNYAPPGQVLAAVNVSPQSAAPSVTSCFIAGTPVRTVDGPRPIEGLRVGDRVLSQDAATGALSFQPILVVHHNPPGRTFRVALDNGETLVPSIYHRFWRAGKGWAIARDLKAGDTLRTLEGIVRVESISPGPVEPLYNLDVAESRSFFVGDHAALVHDNTLPPARLTPFDAEPVLR